MLFVFAVVGTACCGGGFGRRAGRDRSRPRVGNDARFAEYSVAGEFGRGLHVGC
ncbi:hypothetical protein I552_9767 [Mycobacterium xenopi 3993]|nr:hypothetical protein I552_9767 [Mycobacterium xenopi 3993]